MLTIVFFICWVAQLGYLVLFSWKISRNDDKTYDGPFKLNPASIIICAKNEAKNLKKYLPKILSQKYFDSHSRRFYEVIVVDNGSTDDTADVLKSFQLLYPQLLVIQEPTSGKKNALKAGVAAASYNWLVFTDADCRPSSNHWLRAMLRPLAAGKEIVLGYSGFYKAKGLLNAFIRWETVHTFMQYGSYAMIGLPYMGVGRNLACGRGVAEQVMQNPKWNKLLYGDDDMLVSLGGTNRNTAVVCEYRAFTYSKAKKSWGDWARQKQRHLSVGKYYRLPAKLLLAFYGITHAAMWLSLFLLLFTPDWPFVLLAMCLRYIYHIVLFVDLGPILDEFPSAFLYPVFDIGWMMYNFAFLPYIAFKNKKNWK